ncbi:MAG: ribonuclease D [Cryomorphaceae bacterium]|jgi:ribonuclease D
MKIAPFDYIDSDQKLTQFCTQIANADWIAVDTEFMRERTYYAQLALIQVTCEYGSACIDPVAVSNLEPFTTIMQSPDCLKIMHSASQDLEVLNQVMGFVPSPLFDTQIAAGFMGAADQISYAGIVKDRLGIELSKEQTRTNWLQRPLTADQIEYAQLDVVYLKALTDQLSEQLDEKGRLQWHYDECAVLVKRYEQEDAINQAWLRIKSVQSMDAKAQGVVQVVSAWREQLAQERDLPREWVLGKQAIVEIARAGPTDMQGLHSLESLTDKQRQRYGKTLIQLVEQAAENASPLPVHSPLDSAQRNQSKALMSKLRESAEVLSITPALLANRNSIELLVRGERDLPLLRTWRAEQIGSTLLQMLETG